MRISFIIICITFVLYAHAQKINWNNVGPFPIEEKGGIIFYNIDGEKCSDILYQSIFKQFKTKIFLVIQRSMLADDYIPDIFPELSGFQHGDRSLRTPK